MDVDCPPWLDWFHGGLQFQVSHHLFPRVPRHNLRYVQCKVIRLARQYGIAYHRVTFAKGNGLIIATLKEVADQVQFYANVTYHNAKASSAGLHME